jgi:hypothetical protein
MRNSLKIDVSMIKFIPWKKTEQYHILYLTLDLVSDSNLNRNLKMNLKLQGEKLLKGNN